ncbi:MAG: hypothetical protein ABIP55_04875, partial [Tepidisphaeraceae bacterium]
VPVVTMPTPHLRGRLTHAMYRAMSFVDCVANTPSEYVEMCLRLGNDPDWRESVRRTILERNDVLFESVEGVNELAPWLESVALPG